MPDTAIDVKKTPAPVQPAQDAWHSFRREIDRLFDQFDRGFGWPLARLFDPPSRTAAFSFSVPAVDVTEDDKAYTITAELPGLDEKAVEMSLSGDRLVIKGEKRQETEEKNKDCYLSERSYGSFQRSFQLPAGVDREHPEARFAKGVLTVTLPKTDQAQKQTKTIDIKAA